MLGLEVRPTRARRPSQFEAGRRPRTAGGLSAAVIGSDRAPFLLFDPTTLGMNEESLVNSPGRREGGAAKGDMEEISSDADSDETHKHSGLNETDDYTFNVEIVPKHEVENRVVEAGGYTFDGDGGDNELYYVKKQLIGVEQVGKGPTDDSTNINGKGKFREAMKNLIIREGRKVLRKKNDPEKGILAAIPNVFPTAEHRAWRWGPKLLRA
ncbi:hypothetical protein E2562_037203 [Oryza meyeriana var. granulata]|uniref:Uncharacterized protein n=1 Tax=Oryza meyeriana var. granulata TaxID=110450 RepID=A0A6G1C9V5_9ORYZ|nr:hypothetical protein E2562_037203 [Oryza meyeriana var. granulata]